MGGINEEMDRELDEKMDKETNNEIDKMVNLMNLVNVKMDEWVMVMYMKKLIE